MQQVQQHQENKQDILPPNLLQNLTPKDFIDFRSDVISVPPRELLEAMS